MKPEIEYSETLSHSNMDLEILAESFIEPVRKTDDKQFYTQVSIIDVNAGHIVYKNGQPLRYFYEKQNDKDTLVAIVKNVKENIDKLL